MQVVGHDAESLAGWDAASGERLWRLVPALEDDFNVPTPVPAGGRLLVSSENNGTRLYAFDDQGKIVPEPIALNDELAARYQLAADHGQPRLWRVGRPLLPRSAKAD